MTARRRRVGSESEQVPLIVTSTLTVATTDPQWSAFQAPQFTANGAQRNVTKAAPRPVANTVASQYGAGAKSSSPSVTMTSRDRTGEFVTAIRSLQGRQVARAVAVRDPRKARYLQSYGEFMMIARTIGKNITGTYAKLEKLTLLAKRKSLFNDRPTEIQELTYIVKEDLGSLNQQIARLQEVARGQRQTSGGVGAGGTASGGLISHSSSVVLALQSKLAAMSSEFKQVLEVRTENLKQAKSRRDHFSQSPISSSLPPSASTGHHQGCVLLADQQVAINLENHLPQAQAMATVMYDETDQYLTSRAETMQNIESTIVELGGIFQQLAHMVKEQEEMVERIDANVQDTELNVESAHGEILKYFQSVTSNRWLMIKVFAVLIFFFIFFVVFLA